MNATFESLIKLTSSADCSYAIIPIYYETMDGEGIEDVQDQLFYNGFTDTTSLSEHLNSLLNEIKVELTTLIARRSTPQNTLLDTLRQAETRCKQALKNFYTTSDRSGRVTSRANKVFTFISDKSTTHLPPLENTDFTPFHEAMFSFLNEAIKYFSALIDNISINYHYEQQEVAKSSQATGFELENPAKDGVLVDLLYFGLLDAGLIVQGKVRFNSIFSNKPNPVLWNGEINQLSYLINQLKQHVPEILIPTKGKWSITGHCFKIDEKPYPIPSQILKDAEPPKSTKAIDAIVTEISQKRSSYKFKKSR